MYSRCTQVVQSSHSLSSFCLHTTGPSSEIKMARWECEIKIMALRALSSWSSQSQPYGPLGLVLFLHSVLSNMLGEIRVQPACLSVDESAELWSTTGIHPDRSHSNRPGLMCSEMTRVHFYWRPLSHTFVPRVLIDEGEISICACAQVHTCCFNMHDWHRRLLSCVLVKRVWIRRFCFHLLFVEKNISL